MVETRSRMTANTTNHTRLSGSPGGPHFCRDFSEGYGPQPACRLNSLIAHWQWEQKLHRETFDARLYH